MPLYEFVEKVVKGFGIDVAYAGKDDESIDKLGNIDSLLAGVHKKILSSARVIATYISRLSSSISLEENVALASGKIPSS